MIQRYKICIHAKYCTVIIQIIIEPRFLVVDLCCSIYSIGCEFWWYQYQHLAVVLLVCTGTRYWYQYWYHTFRTFIGCDFLVGIFITTVPTSTHFILDDDSPFLKSFFSCLHENKFKKNHQTIPCITILSPSIDSKQSNPRLYTL